MKDVTHEMRVAEFRAALGQYARMFRKLADDYIARAGAEDELCEGIAEGLILASETLESAAEWDSPERSERELEILEGKLDDWPQRFVAGLAPMRYSRQVPEGIPND